ncbi:hypothetical protein [Natronoarchaeum rubrum]|uniref:hypothetical protein n=1 Tax=Natronoarchaeum rubrum TaxID=755311 RepID=UPI0021115702|nr:hypothetical protein [Natronoarchaeum rubrum]
MNKKIRNIASTVMVLWLGYKLGQLVQTWSMIRMPIDEYHDVRMEIEKRLERIAELQSRDHD